MKTKHRIRSYLIFATIILILVLVSFLFPGLRDFTSPEKVKDLLTGLGPWGYVVYVLLLLLIIPQPMPSTPIVLGGGYVFGVVIGTLLSLVAAVIGATIAFLLVRKYGESLLENMVSKEHIDHFRHIFKKRGITAAFIAYAIPIFPNDAINFILGLTKIKYRTFIILVIISHIPRYLIVNSLGQDLFTGFTLRTAIVIVLATVFIVIAAFRRRLKKYFFKELRELEDEAEKIEKKINES